MTAIKTGAVHHQALTVSNLERSVKFYTSLLGFQKVMDLSPTRVLLSNGGAIIALTTPSDPSGRFRTTCSMKTASGWTISASV